MRQGSIVSAVMSELVIWYHRSLRPLELKDPDVVLNAPFDTCVASGNVQNLSESQFPHM